MIEIRECSKSFGSVKAVQNVSMDIGEREVPTFLLIWRVLKMRGKYSLVTHIEG